MSGPARLCPVPVFERHPAAQRGAAAAAAAEPLHTGFWAEGKQRGPSPCPTLKPTVILQSNFNYFFADFFIHGCGFRPSF